MQINFEPKKLKEANTYVDRLNPLNRSKKKSPKKNVNTPINDSPLKEVKSSRFRKVLNFLFK